MQSTHADMPAKKPNVLLAHNRHTLGFVLPVLLLYVPGRHNTHADKPTLSLYLPVAHAVHAMAPSVPEKSPIEHSVLEFRPRRGQKLPSGHNRHDAADDWLMLALKVPATHAVGSADAMGQ